MVQYDLTLENPYIERSEKNFGFRHQKWTKKLFTENFTGMRQSKSMSNYGVYDSMYIADRSSSIFTFSTSSINKEKPSKDEVSIFNNSRANKTVGGLLGVIRPQSMHFYKTDPVTSSISLLPKISLENVYLKIEGSNIHLFQDS